MTGPTAAPVSAELVVTRAVLLAVGAAARGEAPSGSVDELSGRGLVTPDGRPTAAAAGTAAAVGFPLATAQVTAMRPEGARAADLWVGASRAVLHPAGDGPSPVVSVGRSLLPQLVVRATGLGPRPLGDGPPFTADAALLAAACRGTAAPPWRGIVEQPRLWRLTWQVVDGPSGDVAVLDLGSRGLWRPASGQGGQLTWSPTSSATVWRELGRLFAVTLEDRPPS